MDGLLAIVGMVVVLLGGPALLIWRLVTWRSESPESDPPARTARALRARLRFAVFCGLVPAWGIGLVLLLLGVALSGRR